MKTILAAIAALAIATPAYAQYNGQRSGGWDSSTDVFGNTHYNGNGSNSGWTGSSSTDVFGNTHSTFNNSRGQSTNCTTSTDVFGNTHTTCN